MTLLSLAAKLNIRMSLTHTGCLFEPTLRIPRLSTVCAYDLLTSPVLDNQRFPSCIDWSLTYRQFKLLGVGAA